jgi:hypothetical protein
MSEVDKTCRACLQKSKDLFKFNDKAIKERFQKFTSIIIKSDELDSRICKKCHQKLNQAVEFKEQCLKNDDKYRDLFRGEFFIDYLVFFAIINNSSLNYRLSIKFQAKTRIGCYQAGSARFR